MQLWFRTIFKDPPNQPTSTIDSTSKHVKIATWNCRGLHNSKPYILDLIESGVDIIVLQEHWLWTFELPRLSSIHPQHDFTAASDKWLHSSSNLERGCGGPVFRNWLCHIYNCICQKEHILQCFKDGVIIPVFKGKEKDPLLTRNYRGISLTSVFAKVFKIKLSHNTYTWDHRDSSGYSNYKGGVSCTDSIFASKEALAKFKSQGDNVYSCFYDLASVFDTVEFCVLLQSLFHAGIKGNC